MKIFIKEEIDMYTAVAAVAFIALIFTLIVFAILIAFYVILSLALYQMAKNANLENPWLAWIPYLDLYIIGKLIKSLKISTYQIPSIEVVLPVASGITFVAGYIPVLGTIVAIANFVLILFALNKLYKMYKPESAVLFTVLSIFVVPVPFIFQSIKNNTPVEVID
jgi:hypothetical protein